MGLAYQAFDAGKIALARDLLERQRPPEGVVDLRGFEWRRLYGLTRPQDVVAIRSTHGELWGGALSPDGRYFAGGSDAGWFQLWDMKSGREVAGFQSAPDTLYSVAFSPDGSTIAMPFGEKDMHSIQLWDVGTRQPRAVLKGHTLDLLSIVYSPDGRLIASSGGFAYDTDRRGEIILWDAAAPGTFTRLSGHAGSVGFVSFSPDGKLLATPHGDGRIHVWDVSAHRIVRTFEGHRGLVLCVRFSPDGTRIASGGLDGTVRLWDARGTKAPVVVGWHQGAVYALAFSPDGRRLVSGGIDHMARIWDTTSSEEVATLRGHSDRVFTVGFVPGTQRVITDSADGTVRLWEPPSDGGRAFDRQGGVFARLEFSPDGRWLVRSSEDEDKVTLWRDLSKVATIDATFGSVSPDGKVLVTTSKGPSFDVWNLTGERPALVQTIKYANAAAARPVFSPDGRLLAIRTADAITIWTTDDMREAFQLRQPSRGRISAPPFRLMAHGSRPALSATWCSGASPIDLATCSRLTKRTSMRWRSRRTVSCSRPEVSTTRASLARIGLSDAWRVRADAGAVMSLTFAQTAGRSWRAQDGLVQLWNTATRREIASWKAHTTIVSGLAFSRGDTVLATVSVDHEMRLDCAGVG
jgi:WD40 repeat protein